MKKEQDYDVEFILPSGREDLTELLRAVIVQKLQGQPERLGGEEKT